MLNIPLSIGDRAIAPLRMFGKGFVVQGPQFGVTALLATDTFIPGFSGTHARRHILGNSVDRRADLLHRPGNMTGYVYRLHPLLRSGICSARYQKTDGKYRSHVSPPIQATKACSVTKIYVRTINQQCGCITWATDHVVVDIKQPNGRSRIELGRTRRNRSSAVCQMRQKQARHAEKNDSNKKVVKNQCAFRRNRWKHSR